MELFFYLCGMNNKEVNKAIFRWGQGQFCLITEYEALSNPDARLFAIRYSVGGEYGYMVKYSRKVVRKIFLGFLRKAGVSPLSYLTQFHGTFQYEQMGTEQHLLNHDL